MDVYIANFGRENYEWPVCRERGTIATMNAVAAQAFWKAGDREGYIANRMATDVTARGDPPTRATASRWYNLMSIICASVDDLWIHRDGDLVWWTVSTGTQPMFERKTERTSKGEREVVTCHKPCTAWSSRAKGGVELLWRSLHPKARDFLSTEATLQKLSSNYAAYACALIEGSDLEPWHSSSLWRQKNEAASSRHAEVRLADAKTKVAYREADELIGVARMAKTAMQTAAQSNGQEVLRRLKNKEVRFPSTIALQDYIVRLLERQEGICALTDLAFDYDEKAGDKALFVSLDRINSDGHYEKDNLQVVCRFANRWKGDGEDGEFRRLMKLIRGLNDTPDVLSSSRIALTNVSET